MLEDISLNEQLMNAIEKGDIGEVRSLLDRGADVNATDQNGYTVLYKAVRSFSIETVGLLLDKGADVNAQDYSGRTPISLALKDQKKVDVLFTFLVYGATLDEDDRGEINEVPNLRDCLIAFEQIEKESPHLRKLIVNSRNIRKIGSITLKYIDDETKRQGIIEEFKKVVEDYGSHKQLSFIPECLLSFVEYVSV